MDRQEKSSAVVRRRDPIDGIAHHGDALQKETRIAQINISGPEMPQNAPECPNNSKMGLQINMGSELPGELSSRQMTAIQLLSLGRTLSGTAETLRLDRKTLFRWRMHDPVFAAELERRQREMYESAAGKIRTTLLKSLAVIDQSLRDRDEATRTALKFVSYMDVKKHLAAPEPREAAEIADDVVRRFRRQAGIDPNLPISEEERALVLNQKSLESPAGE